MQKPWMFLSGEQFPYHKAFTEIKRLALAAPAVKPSQLTSDYLIGLQFRTWNPDDNKLYYRARNKWFTDELRLLELVVDQPLHYFEQILGCPLRLNAHPPQINLYRSGSFIRKHDHIKRFKSAYTLVLPLEDDGQKSLYVEVDNEEISLATTPGSLIIMRSDTKHRVECKSDRLVLAFDLDEKV